MRKKILSVALGLAMMLSLTACGSDNTTASTNNTPTSSPVSTDEKVQDNTDTSASVSVDNTDNVPTEYEECELIYRGILEDCYNCVYYGMEPLYDKLYSLKADTVYYSPEEKDKVGFCFVDIDGDGRSEMLVGSPDVLNVICGYNDNGAYVINCAGYRSRMSVFENGNVLVEGSDSASEYSYNFYIWENSDLKLADHYYSDYNFETETVKYYHTTSGSWNPEESEELTEDVYNLSTETGLEVLSFEDKYTPLSTYSEIWGGGSEGINWAALVGTTWDLAYTQDKDNYYDKSDFVMQYIQFLENGTIVYCHNDEGNDYFTSDIEFEENEYSNDIYISLTDELERRVYLTIKRINGNDMLVIQRSWYDAVSGESRLVNEYYTESWG